jgi:uncharacterized membrane protein YsdA (DUF1294 family)
MRPDLFHGGMSAGLSVALMVLLLVLFRAGLRWPTLLAAWLASVNLVAFGYYGFDKARAQRGGWRVPEVVLHGLALVGGSLGAYAGMEVFRHKTIKGGFRIFFWVIVAFQVALIAVVIYRLVRG